MRTRTRRAVRRPEPTRVRLTERDRWLLEALGKMRFLTTRQLARLGFGASRWAVNKRLRALFDHGLVRVWVPSLSADNIYSLDHRGARLLGEPGAYPFVPRGLDGRLPHLIMLNEVRIGLALGLPEDQGELEWWRSDWELRAGRRGTAVPDALFAIGQNGTTATFALEVEQSGRSPKKFLAKMLSYRLQGARMRALYGIGEFTLLVVGRDDRSVERHQHSLLRLGQGSVWFTTVGEVASQGALAAIWRSAHGRERYSLRNLLSLP